MQGPALHLKCKCTESAGPWLALAMQVQADRPALSLNAQCAFASNVVWPSALPVGPTTIIARLADHEPCVLEAMLAMPALFNQLVSVAASVPEGAKSIAPTALPQPSIPPGEAAPEPGPPPVPVAIQEAALAISLEAYFTRHPGARREPPSPPSASARIGDSHPV